MLINIRYTLSDIHKQVFKIAKSTVFSTLDLKSAYYQVPHCAADRLFISLEADRKLYQYTRLHFGIINDVSFFQRVITCTERIINLLSIIEPTLPPSEIINSVV